MPLTLTAGIEPVPGYRAGSREIRPLELGAPRHEL